MLEVGQRATPPRIPDDGIVLSLAHYSITLARRDQTITPIRDVNLDVRSRETVAIVGESGSGKTLTALSLLGLLPTKARPSISGTAVFDGEQLPPVGSRRWRQLRGTKVAMIFQDPLSAMNPAMTVGNQIAELYRHRADDSRPVARRRALEAMEHVRIPDARRRYDSYPHQFSGGMRQRAMIAMAIALRPNLLIADEPTTALDVTVQAEILDLLRELQRDERMSVIFITHDLAVARSFADSISVMYAGRTVESGRAADVLARPSHPYTVRLRESMPNRRGGSLREPIPGSPPDPAAFPSGCAFHPRCHRVHERCRTDVPPLLPHEARLIACHAVGAAAGTDARHDR